MMCCGPHLRMPPGSRWTIRARATRPRMASVPRSATFCLHGSLPPNRRADLGTEAIRGLVARARIVHRDPGGMRKCGPQHIMGFVQETLFAGDQQANDLPLGDQDPDPP